jgi:hypothetical protein
MGKLKDFFSKYKLVKSSDLDTMLTQATDKGMQEEKGWHNHPDRGFENKGMSIGLTEGIDDYSYLYEQKDPEEEISAKQIHESFIGTYTNADSYNSLTTQSSDGQESGERESMQAAAFNKYFSDPHCKSIIDNWVYYTVGGGLKVAAENKKVMTVINDFRRKNQMLKREKEFIKMAYLEGELFIAYYIDKSTGQVQIRRIRPFEIKGIETHPGDIETKFAYHWEYEYSPAGTEQTYKKDIWIPDTGYADYQQLSNAFKSAKPLQLSPTIQHIKFGIDTEIRGRVPLQPILKYLKYYDDWLMDRIRLNHERAKVVWIKEVRGRMSETTLRERRAPRGGIMMIETDNVKYRIEKAQINADDAKEDGLAILYAIGAGTNLPIHILNQRSDQAVYASIRKADTPFSQFIRGQQEFLEESFDIMYRQVIKSAVEAGTLPKRVRVPEYTQEAMDEVLGKINQMAIDGVEDKAIKEEAEKMLRPALTYRPIATVDIPITIEFPEVIREDLEAQAKVFKIHKEIGIVSSATLSAKAGYNWRQELVNMINEKELIPEPTGAETKKPETKKPETKKPETKKPETKKPETKKPETKKPETKKPETKKPESGPKK